MVEKEIWVYLLAYNLIRLLMAQSALLADQVPRQLSFKHAVQLWLVWKYCRDRLGTALDLAALLALMAQPRVGLRPGPYRRAAGAETTTAQLPAADAAPGAGPSGRSTST